MKLNFGADALKAIMDAWLHMVDCVRTMLIRMGKDPEEAAHEAAEREAYVVFILCTRSATAQL